VSPTIAAVFVAVMFAAVMLEVTGGCFCAAGCAGVAAFGAGCCLSAVFDLV
jgi:hypothetical protein